MNETTFTVDEIARDLDRLGVVQGDVVMVHASLRAIGPVEDGAAGVVRALEAAVGESGTLLMTLGARNDWEWVNEHPEADRPRLLADAEPFDHRRTPADPDVGIVAEVFRQLPGTLTSDNPEGRFGVRGRQAAFLVDNAPWHDYYGPGSPLDRLVQLEGKVLRLGADLDAVTALHYAEYLVPLEGKRRVRRHRLVVGSDGSKVRHVDCLDDSTGIVDHPNEDYFITITRGFLASGRAALGVVGRTRSELFLAADLIEYGASWMAQHLAPRQFG